MPIPHVTPGQPWRPNANKENAWTDAANDFASRRFSTRPGTDIDRKFLDSGSIWVKNVSASHYDRYSVVGLRDPIFTDPAQAAFGQFTGFEVSSPFSSASPFAIIQEPLPIGVANRTGVNVGVTPCSLLVNDVYHAFAKPVAGQTGWLESAENGPAEILWKAGDEGTVWAIVRILRESIVDIMGDAPELYDGVTEVCLIDGDTSAAKTYPAEDTTVSGDTWTTVIGPTSYTAQAIGTVKIRVSIDWRDSVSYSQDSYEFRLLINGSEAGVGPALICTGIGGFQDNRTAIFPVTVADLDPHDFEVQARQSTADGGEALLLETSFMQPGSGIGITVEHRTALLPEDVVIGDPECVVNPTNCCADDTTSSSSGDTEDDQCPPGQCWDDILGLCYDCCAAGNYFDPDAEGCIPIDEGLCDGHSYPSVFRCKIEAIRSECPTPFPSITFPIVYDSFYHVWGAGQYYQSTLPQLLRGRVDEFSPCNIDYATSPAVVAGGTYSSLFQGAASTNNNQPGACSEAVGSFAGVGMQYVEEVVKLPFSKLVVNLGAYRVTIDRYP